MKCIKYNQTLRYLILFLFPLSLLSQNIKGIVYDNASTVKGIKVYNISKKLKTYTSNEGDFEISASINDTLFFESLFHHPKHIKLKEIHFEDIAVFELKKVVNELGEVLLVDQKAKEFNEVEYTDAIGFSIANDRKNNPHLYGSVSKYGVDFIYLARKIAKLFKRKNKSLPITYISYKHLDSLFKNDDLFDLKLLKQDLNIPEEYAHLFLDYCETKNLNKILITEQRKVVLLDSFVNFSKEFLKIIEDFETSKDTLGLKN
ncbi:hypothetical protein EYD45_01735 [Hyunsoonleella flava]|uniref:Carboxypeptidase-like regulatory domain-containing protein n=1 Tax=Hyunsoonleella flava TaxID=2527939 RepID=A0A4Q9FLQ6_9FLAO|nr:hypothetical protein [Hyunsoonleella flava]TBN06630.1 hypothetical protein EYD45_01735 [Hyunsoonleella flava]